MNDGPGKRAANVRRLSAALLCAAAAMMPAGCESRELRGKATPSGDGKTYLIVADDNGGQCGPIMVDGTPWPHKLHVPGPLAPGTHRISCGGEIEFIVKAGTTFHFDYWGP